FFFQAEDGIRDATVTGVQTCALPISPIYLAGKARPGPTFEDNRRMHAVARILLDGRIPNVQVSWVKMGMDYCKVILQGGANDFEIGRASCRERGEATQRARTAKENRW